GGTREFTVRLPARRARRQPPESLKELWRPIGMLLGGLLLVILLEPDLGTAITLTIMVGAVLFASGARVRILGGGFALLCAGGLLLVLTRAYMRARLFSFLDPWPD